MKLKHITLIASLLFAHILCAQNNSLTLDGVDEYIDLADGIANYDNFTFEAWVYWNGPTNDPWQRIFDFGNSYNTGNMFLTPSEDQNNFVRFAITNSNFEGEQRITSSINLTLHQWHHIAVSIDFSGDENGQGILYIDGNIVGSNNSMTIKPSSLGNTTNTWIGKSQYDFPPYNNSYYNGKIDEIRIWNTVRTKTQIRANMYSEISNAESNLKAYYKLNESSGSSVPCSVSASNGLLMNMEGNEWETSPPFYGPGNCLEFDGENDFVACGNLPSISDITVEAWIKPDQNGAFNQYVFGEWGEPWRAQFTYNMNIGNDYKINFYNPTFGTQGGGTRISSQTSLNDGKWHHIAWVDSADIKFICIDGIREVSGSSNNAIYDNMISSIGGSNQETNDNFDGQIDEVRVWNYARTQSDIIENMNKQLTGNETGLIAYYNFNNDNSSILQNFSPNTFDGTLNNMDSSTDWISSEAYNTWLNTSSTSWSTATNWSRNSVPNATDNVGIYTEGAEIQPVIDNSLDCNNLIIATANTFEIENTSQRTIHGSVWNYFNTNVKNNVELTITGSLYMMHNSQFNILPKASLTIEKNLHTRFLGLNGTFNVKSDETGTGSLIVSGSSTGDVTMERYIESAIWGEWNDGWHQIASPVDDYTITGNFTVEPATQYDFYAWSEPDNQWINFKDGTDPTFATVNGSSNFVAGTGYLVAYENTSTKSFTGEINVSDVDVSDLSLTGTTQSNRSWHLLGNPFTSGLTWDDTWIRSDITGTAQIWNEINRSYSAITSGTIIPATNGFMVQATVNNASLTIPKSKRTHGGTFFKSTEFPLVKLKANNLDYPSAQESLLLFNPESTNNWDMEYDSDFIPGFAPLFYSEIDDQPMAVNSMPNIEENTSIPFTFIKNEGINFSIEMYENLNMELDVWLLDKKLNRDHNLTQNSVYLFTAFEQDNNNRFEIHFSPVDIEEITIESAIQFYSFSNKINIINNNNLRGVVNILNIMGQTVVEVTLNSNNLQEINLNVPTGIYIVNITSTDGLTDSQKVFITN